MSTVGCLLGTARSGCHLQNTARGNLTEYEGGFNQWDEGKSRDSAKDNEAEAEVDVEIEVTEGRDKSQGCDGMGDVEGVAQVPKASDSAFADATDVDTIRSKLWELQRLLNNLKGSLSATYKKNTETNTKAYDLNQKTMLPCSLWQRNKRSSRRLPSRSK